MALSGIRMVAQIIALHPPASPGDGAVLQELLSSDMLSDGTGSLQADRVASKEYTIAGSGSQAIDLTTLTDAYGTAIAAVQVVGIMVKNHKYLSDGTTLGGGVCNVSPNATNGWTGALASASDVLKIPRGGTWPHFAPDVGMAVSASNKVLDLENPNSGSIRVSVIVLARSA